MMQLFPLFCIYIINVEQWKGYEKSETGETE